MTVKSFISVAALAAATGLAATSALAQITISTVPVGNPGNAADPSSGWGSVAYSYNIGTYEVTAGQYTAFLNAVARTDTYGLYNTDQARTDYGSGITRSGSSGNYSYSVDAAFVDRPVNYVSFWDSTRFSNWLHNGQPTGPQNAGTTEDGAYTLTSGGISANTITRNTGAQWAVTSEDEWYKAAYYKGGNTNAGYWVYPTGSNTAPGNDLADPTGNNANYYTGSGTYPIQSPYFTTVVGEFQNSASPYGTFDQGGNVFEWNEKIITGAVRQVRGGSFIAVFDDALRSNIWWFGYNPAFETSNIGFRVSQVPAPGSVALLAISGLLAARRRR